MHVAIIIANVHLLLHLIAGPIMKEDTFELNYTECSSSQKLSTSFKVFTTDHKIFVV